MDNYHSEGNQEETSRHAKDNKHYMYAHRQTHRDSADHRFSPYNSNHRQQGQRPQRQSRFDSAPSVPFYNTLPPPLLFNGSVPPPPLPPMPPHLSHSYGYNQEYGSGAQWQASQISRYQPVPPPLPQPVSAPVSSYEAKPDPPGDSTLSVPLSTLGTETDLKDQGEEVNQEEVKKTTKKPIILVGKRRGGKILPTGNLGVAKKPREEAEKGRSDAWSRYMAEVKQYKDRSCEEDRKNRPLVK